MFLPLGIFALCFSKPAILFPQLFQSLALSFPFLFLNITFLDFYLLPPSHHPPSLYCVLFSFTILISPWYSIIYLFFAYSQSPSLECIVHESRGIFFLDHYCIFSVQCLAKWPVFSRHLSAGYKGVLKSELIVSSQQFHPITYTYSHDPITFLLSPPSHLISIFFFSSPFFPSSYPHFIFIPAFGITEGAGHSVGFLTMKL